MTQASNMMTKCTCCRAKVKTNNLQKHYQKMHPTEQPPLDPKVIKPRKPAMRGKRYEIVVCEQCGIQIYKRHLSDHVNEFHTEPVGIHQTAIKTQVVRGIDLANLSFEFQSQIKQNYVIDDRGILVRYEDCLEKKEADSDSESNSEG